MMWKLIRYITLLVFLLIATPTYAAHGMMLAGSAGSGAAPITYDLNAPFLLGEVGTNSYDFVAASGDYVTVADSNDFSFGNGSTDTPFSVCAWRINGDGATGYIASKLSATGSGEWDLYDASGVIQFHVVDDSAGGECERRTTTVIPTGDWAFVCGTYDGTGLIGGLDIYINGVVSDVNGTCSSYTAMENLGDAVAFGATSTGGTKFEGNIAKVIVTSDVLSQAEVDSLMFAADCTAQNALVDNVVSCWDMDADLNSDVGSHNGTAQGSVAPAAPADYPGLSTSSYALVNTQVLDAEAMGVSDGSLTVDDGGGTTIEITGNELGITGLNDDSTVHSTSIVTRELGRAFLVDITTPPTGVSYWGFGFDTTTSDVVPDTLALNSGTNTLTPYENGTSSGSYFYTTSTSTEYMASFVLGGYDSNGIPYKSGDTKADFTYGGSIFVKPSAGGNHELIWKGSGHNANAYAQVTSNWTHTQYKADDFRIPTDTLESLIQPNNLSLFAGAAAELDAYTPDVGGSWTENSGDWDTDGSGVLVNTTAGIATFTGEADGIFDVTITTPGAGTDPGGLVYRLSDTSNYWYAKITPGTAGTDFEIIEEQGGSTQRASADVDWAVSTAYAVRVITDGATGQWAFVDGVAKLTYTTSNTFNETETGTGLQDEANGNFTSWDTVANFSRGTGGEYVSLDDY